MPLVRVIHTLPGVRTEASGPTYSVSRLAESLCARGTQSELAVLDYGRSATDFPQLRAFPITTGPKRLGPSAPMRRWLAEEVRHGRVDAIHSHGLWMMPNVYPGWATRGSQVPLVVSPRGTLSEWAFGSGSPMKRAFWRLLQRPAIRHARLFHATSEQEADDVAGLGFDAPIAVIPNGVDIPSAAEIEPKRRPPYVAFLGRIHPNKGIDLLLRAWRSVEREVAPWTLEIAGPDSGAHAAEMRQLARELGTQRVSFRGAMWGRDKTRFLSSASVSVLPTHSENFGMAIAESLACGTPAIVTKGAPWSGLDSRGAGWWIDRTEQDLAATLHAASTSGEAVLAGMGLAGRSWMLEEHSWPRLADMFGQTYRWLLGSAAAPACLHR